MQVAEDEASLAEAGEIEAATVIQKHVRGFLSRKRLPSAKFIRTNSQLPTGSLSRTRWLTSNDTRLLSAQVHDCLVAKYRRGIAKGIPSKRVVIVGGGPVGLKAAIETACLGHKVTLLEARPGNLRARNIGIHVEDQEYLALLGMPALMTCSPTEGREKRGITLMDLQDFLLAAALKLGVVIFMNTEATWTSETLENGIINGSYRQSSMSVTDERQEGMVRRHFTSKILLSADAIEQFSFDILIDASGSYSKLREDLIGIENVGALKQVAKVALDHCSKIEEYFNPERDHHVNSRIGSVQWEQFVKDVANDTISDRVFCLVSNMPVTIFKNPDDPPSLIATNVPGRVGAEPFPDWFYFLFPKYRKWGTDCSTVPKEQLAIPDVDEMCVSVDKPFRVHFEGPFPLEWKGVDVSEQLQKNWKPVEIALDLLKLIGPPVSDQISLEGWKNYVESECSFVNPAQNTTDAFLNQFMGILTKPNSITLHGTICEAKEFYIVGDAIQVGEFAANNYSLFLSQTPWYRFGIGVHDGFHSVNVLRSCLECPTFEQRKQLVLALEERMRIRAVQVLMSLHVHWIMMAQYAPFVEFLDRIAERAKLRAN